MITQVDIREMPGEEAMIWLLQMLTLAVMSRGSVVDAVVVWGVALIVRVGSQGRRLTRLEEGHGPDHSLLGKGITKEQLKVVHGKRVWVSLQLETMVGVIITDDSIIRIRIRIKEAGVRTIARARDKIAT